MSFSKCFGIWRPSSATLTWQIIVRWQIVKKNVVRLQPGANWVSAGPVLDAVSGN